MKRQFGTLAVLLLFMAAPASADVTMEMMTRYTKGHEKPDNLIYVKGERVRVDNVGGAPGHMSMLLKDGEMIVLNHDEQSYAVFNKETMDGVKDTMSEAMKMMEAQLAQMPPEQRAMAEEMMKSQTAYFGSASGVKDIPAPRLARGGGIKVRWLSLREVCGHGRPGSNSRDLRG